MISVIVSTFRPRFINNIIENFSRQTLEEKELILILNSNSIDVSPIKKKIASCRIRASIHSIPSKISLGECLNHGVRSANYPVIAKFDDDDYYGKYYLEEAQHSLAESGAEIAGKRSFFIYFKNTQELRLFNPYHEHEWVPSRNNLYAYKNTYFFSGGTLIIKKKIAEAYPFPDLNRGEDSRFQQNCFLNGIRMYATSRMNYVYLRYPGIHNGPSDHQDLLLKRKSDFVARTVTFRRYVNQSKPEY
ncbi:glycosyltransferase [Sporolactobacillus vineae]|uniref:glycosyltransferase n=1 Tax=Sporolactobacillus vineae TaxID=444463 RepID=UPI000289E93B|nr:glycosyltransferase family A protein [Sporolactobacillus vineae]